MTAPALNTWQAVQQEVRRRIQQRLWKPGEFIPHEADLAREFGCARATVNRALRELAEAGLLDRRRKAGTRIALNPVSKARLDIPVIRDEIESRGLVCRHTILLREMTDPPPDIRARMRTAADADLLHVQTLYTADGTPYVFESRWINPGAVPGVVAERFADLSPNEWLIREAAFEGGDFTFSAIAATQREASVLSCAPGEGLFVLDRTTWIAGQVITSVRLIFHPGYRMHTEL